MRRSELLLTVSEELDDLGASVSAIQTALGEVLADVKSMGQSGFRHVQEIDRVQQTLQDLSAILRVAAESDGPTVEVERLVRAARLGALRRRLGGSGNDGAAGQNAGFVSIF